VPGDELAREVGAVLHVDATARDGVVEAEVVQQPRDDEDLSVHLGAAPRGQLARDQKDTQPVALVRAVGLAGRLPDGGERVALG